MQVTLSGKVHYANGDPLPGVVVHIFDRDSAGGQDDDLTIVPGISDDRGCFTLTYEPLRFLDYHKLYLPRSDNQPGEAPGKNGGLSLPDLGDIYLPYLRFNYTYNQVQREFTASLHPFQKEFNLPVNPPVSFLPSLNGFRFPNRFSGYFLPYSTPAFMSRKVSSQYGLCGGMCAAAYDFLLARKPIPPNEQVPSQGSRLQRYLFRRQMDSLGGLGQSALKVAQWTSLPDDTLIGTCRRTADVLPEICQKLDDGNLVVLALIYEHASSVRELARLVFNNHQALAYGHQESASGAVTIHIYDPNLPGHDDVDIHAELLVLGQEDSPAGPVAVRGFACTELVVGTYYRTVRGLFGMAYVPVKPPKTF